MAQCPECDTKIDELTVEEQRTTVSTLSIVDGRIHSDVDHAEADSPTFSCPVCGEDISGAVGDSALAFLKGGDQ